MTNEQRIELLETALENLLDCFDGNIIEVEIDGADGTVIVDGFVTGYVAEALDFAAHVLADEGVEYDAEDEN